jgi:hypothetical protein
MTTTAPVLNVHMPDGSTIVYSGTQVISCTVVEQTDTSTATLPVSKLEASVLDTAGQFSPFQTGTFEDKQLIEVYESINGIEYFIGNYYLDEWESDERGVLKLEATNFIGLLDSLPFGGRFYSELTPIHTILQHILISTGVEYSLIGEIQTKKLQGWLSPGPGSREALQQVCLAAGAIAVCGRMGELVFMPTPIVYGSDSQNFNILLNHKFRNQPLSMLPVVTAIDVVSHNYVAGADVKTVFDATLDPGTYTIIFDEPLYDLEVSGGGYSPISLTTEDGTLLTTEDGEYEIFAGGSYDFGPNSVTLYVETTDDVTITGHPWVDNKRVYRFEESDLGPYAKTNELSITDATLVSNDNAQDVLDTLRDYYRQRYSYEMTLVPREGTKYGTFKYGEKPYGWSPISVYIGKTASITTQYDNRVRMAIEQTDLDLSGGCLVKLRTRGVEIVE